MASKYSNHVMSFFNLWSIAYLLSNIPASLPFEMTHPIFAMNPRAVFPMAISLALQENLAVFSVKEIHQF